jgi:hypothetical protein
MSIQEKVVVKVQMKRAVGSNSLGFFDRVSEFLFLQQDTGLQIGCRADDTTYFVCWFK